MDQKTYQFHEVENKPPIEAKPPICLAPSLLKINERDLT
jgi:hypothetical protein